MSLDVYSPPRANGSAHGVDADQERTLSSLVAQLESVYADQTRDEAAEAAARDTVASLEAQVAALLEERDDMIVAMERFERRAERAERRSQEVLADLAEAATHVE
jgi:ketosteroid isomerase-like protein